MKEFIQIGSKKIGPGHPCFIIAEAGVNHNGKLDLAKSLVRKAKTAGADCAKFQTFRAERVVTLQAPKADYQLRVTDPAESQFAMLKALELSEADHIELMKQCREDDILFLSTPYSWEDAEMLHDLGVAAFKIASGQIIELAFLEEVARLGHPMILSTGMATMGEIERALETVRSTGNDQVVLLQCTTNYPSAPSDANLLAMGTLARTFQSLVGYSDHTEGNAVALASVALGACVVEKHFTLDKAMPGPDHACSADPSQLLRLVEGIREVESAFGSAVKRPTESEKKNALGMRRSIVAKVAIPKGTKIERSMVCFKRPGIGLSPDRLSEVLGRVAATQIPADSLLDAKQLD